MLGRLISIGTTAAGFMSGGGWIPLAIVACVAGAGGAGGAWWIQSYRIDGLETKVTAAEDRYTTMKVNRDALYDAIQDLGKEIAGLHTVMDAENKRAAAVKATQAAQIASLADRLRLARDDDTTFLQQIEVQHHAPPAASPVRDGFDPLILASFDRLRCLARAANRHQGGADCRIPIQGAAGGAGLAPGSAGAGDWRPTFQQQLWLVSFVYQLRTWGDACRGDKQAIAATQAEGAAP
jgi:uncharacterized membrane protein